MSETTAFNPGDFTIELKGKDYLPVAARVKWFRNIHPSGSIETREMEVDMDRSFRKGSIEVYGYARFHATVRDQDGRILGQGTKTENAANFPDYVEKAETGAIGRALAAAGFGTALDGELDEGRVVDSPRERLKPQMMDLEKPSSKKKTSAASKPAAGAASKEAKSDGTGGAIRLHADILEWLEQQSKRAGFEDLKDACTKLDYPFESVLTIDAMQRSLDKELKQRIAAKAS